MLRDHVCPTITEAAACCTFGLNCDSAYPGLVTRYAFLENSVIDSIFKGCHMSALLNGFDLLLPDPTLPRERSMDNGKMRIWPKLMFSFHFLRNLRDLGNVYVIKRV